MPAPKFTKNYRDRSSDTGFQFEFFCDRGYGQWMPGWLAYHFPESCNYSYLSTTQPYPVGVANKVKEAASWLATRFPQVSAAGDALNKVHKEAWESAFAAGVQEAKRHFRHCEKCDKWVCSHACWSDTADACKSCAGFGVGLGPSASQGNGEQPDTVICQHCGDTTERGKFCATCGKSLALTIFCGNCGKKMESDRRYKFCPHCGDSLSYVDEIVKEGKGPQ